ncbi:MAG: hypothetical protein AAF849_18695, partial [Bacteroidota bacterium]
YGSEHQFRVEFFEQAGIAAPICRRRRRRRVGFVKLEILRNFSLLKIKTNLVYSVLEHSNSPCE